jgi:thiol:disulfide interchange protein
MWDTLTVVLLAMATFVLSEFLGIYLELNLLVTLVLSFGLAFLLFQALKRKVVRSCIAILI